MNTHGVVQMIDLSMLILRQQPSDSHHLTFPTNDDAFCQLQFPVSQSVALSNNVALLLELCFSVMHLWVQVAQIHGNRLLLDSIYK